MRRITHTLRKNVLLMMLLLASLTGHSINYYWVGGSGSWSDFADHWATTSGGSTFQAQVPTANDDVYFDANSFTGSGQTVNCDNTVVFCHNMDWSAATHSPQFSQATASSTVNVFGSLTLISAMNWNISGSVVFLSNSTGNTITSAHQTYKNAVSFEGSGGGWTLQDSLKMNGAASGGSSGLLTLDFGSLNTNSQAINCIAFISSNSNVRSLNMSNSVFTLNYNNYTASSYVWNTSSNTNFTFSATGSTINLPGTYSYMPFQTNNLTFNNLAFTYNGGTGYQQFISGSGNTFNGTVSFAGVCTGTGGNIFNGNVSCSGVATIGGGNSTFNGAVTLATDGSFTSANTFNGALNLNPGGTYQFQSGVTQSISSTGSLSAAGTCTQPITLKSTTNGSQATISKTGANLNVDQTIIQDIKAVVSTGFTANATNSFDGGDNTNWVFPAFAGPAMYWIGGAGNWNDPTHWSFTSGGAAGSCIPGPGNDVFFDANSFTSTSKTVTVNVSNVSCKSMSWTGAGNTPTFASSSTSNNLNVYGSMTLISAMTLNYNGILTFASKTTGNTITSAGKTWPMPAGSSSEVFFNGVGGSWSFQDAFSTNGILSLTNGTLNTNNQSVTDYYFESQNSNIRTLNLGSSTWLNTGYYWLVSNGTNLTLNAGTSTIRITYCCFGYFYGGNQTYYNVSMEATQGSPNYMENNNTFNGTVTFLGDGNIEGTNTFNGNLTLTPGHSYMLQPGTTQTISATGSLTANGTCGNYIMLSSETPGSQATINKVNGNLVADNTILKDIKATLSVGYLANATDASVDLGDNTNWNFGVSTGSNFYWIGGAGNWNDPNHWSLSTGGAHGTCVPGPLDNVFFDSHSFSATSQAVSVNISNALCKNMVWTGALFTPTFQYTISGNLRIFGSLTLISAMNFNYFGTIYFQSISSGNTITMAGKTFSSNVYFAGGSTGSWTLQDAFSSNSYLELTSGTLNTNNQAVTCLYFTCTSGQPRALNLGASTFSIQNYYWNVSNSNFSFNPGTSTIHMLNEYTGAGSIYPLYAGGLTYNNVTFESGVNPGDVQGTGTFNGVVTFNGVGQIDGNNTFNGNVVFNDNGNITSNNTYNSTLRFTPGKTYTLTSGATQTFSPTGTLSAVGSPCSPIALFSSVNGTASSFSKASGEVCADYLYIVDAKAAGAATWSAGLHSTNSTPTVATGWQNIACSSPLQSSVITASGPLCGSGSVTLSSRTASSYLWSTGATTQSIVITSAGTYTLSIVNLNGCTESGSLTIVSSAVPPCSVTGASSTCPSATETYNGPSGMAGYAWSVSGPAGIPGSAISSSVGVVPTTCGTYTVAVTVTNTGGCTSACGAITTVVDTIAPTISCPGNMTVSHATGLCGKNVSFSVTAADNCGTPTIVSTPASGSFFPVGSTTVTSVATDNCGNTASCSFTITVTVDPMSASTTHTNTCSGSSTGTITTSVTGGSGTYGYSWTGGATGANPTGLAVGTYSVTVTDGGCTSSVSATATVTANPLPTVTSPANYAVCAGTATSLSGSGASTYTWTGGITNGVSFTPTGTATYTVTGTDALGCKNTSATTVTVNSLPTVTAPASSAVCAGTSVTLSGGGAVSYSWTGGVTNGVPFTPTSSATYTVIGTDANSCSNNATTTVTVNALPTVTAHAGTDPICLGGSATLTAGGAGTYSWAPSTDLSATSGATVTASPTTTTIYTVTGTDAHSCSNTATVTVTVNPLFAISASSGVNGSISPSGTTTLCLGSSQTYTITAASGYHIQNVLVDGSSVGTGSAYTFSSVSAAHSISASFAPNCTAPVITVCPGSVTRNNDAGICGATVTYSGATVTGTSPTVTYSAASGSTFDVGTTTVTVNATNSCGSASCTFNVTVNDAETPTITAPADVAVNTNTACTATGVVLGTPATADNCSVASVTHSPAEPYALGTTVVTWTVTDGSGNTATATQNVVVTDNVNPTITAPADVAVHTNTACTATGVVLGTPATADNCSVASVTHSPAEPYALGTTVVTWTVTDGSGNTATATQNVVVTDNVNPTITAPADVAVHTNTACTATGVALGTPATADNCSVASVTHTPAEPYALGTTVVTWTVTDGSGNTATATQNVTVTDNVAPTITAPADVAVHTNTACTATGVALGTPATADNCSVASVTHTPTEPYALGTTVVTWTVTDGSGNTATATQNVVVTDNVNPTITAPADVAVNTNTACTATGVALGTPATADNCSVASVTHTPTEPYALGTTVVTWTVTDGSGNTATATQNVVVTDNVNPTIIAPADVAVNTNTACTATGVALGTPATADNCSVASVTHTPAEPYALGTTVVTWTVTDGSGNTATATQNVVVTDNVNPTITAPADVAVNTNTACTATGVVLGTPATADNCSVASVTHSPAEPYALGTTVVTWTVTDGSGNTATATQNVVVTDNVNPTITAPADVAVHTNTACTATGVALGTPATADNCSVASVTHTPAEPYALGTTVVTWTVTDGSGNTATATQNVTVADNVNPTITAPADVAVNTNTACTATGVALGTPATADNCSVASVTHTPAEPYALGTTVVTWTVTDGSGNTATATQNVTVTDNVAPTITAPADVAVHTNTACTATGVALGTPATADNCSVASVTHSPVEPYALGTTVVTWTVTDGSGNTATATQNVTVTDNVAPTITAPANVTVYTNTACTATGVSLGTPSVSDNCSVASVTHSPSEPYALGTTVVTWTVIDGSGNTTTATQTVTVIDNVHPTITAPANVSVNNDAGSCSATVSSLGTPVTGDNCSIASVTNDHSSSTYPVGTTTVTWTVTDGSGNTTTATQTVTVTDNQAPTITAPANVTINGYCVPTTATLGTPVTGDNCGVASVTNDAPSLYPVGTTSVHWTVTDIHGNSTSATQTVTVVPGTVTLSPSVTNVSCYGLSNGSVSVTASGGTGSFTYLWSTGATTSGLSSKPAGAYSVTATDTHGCTASATYTITQPAALSLSSAVASNGCHNAHNGSINSNVTGGTAPYTYHWSNGSTAANLSGLYPGTYSLTVTDAHGCTASASYTITNPATLSAWGSVSNVACYGGNGTVTTTVSGGTTPYAYAWSNGATTANLTAHAGSYTLIVTDAAGCTNTQYFTIWQPSALTFYTSLTNVSCNGGNNGYIDADVYGGTYPYSYSWSTGGHGYASYDDLYSAPAGTYTVTVTDGNGCTLTQVDTVTQPAPITITGTVVNETCHGGSTGSISVSASGGTPWYSYSFSGYGGGYGSSRTGLAAGSFTVTVTDGNWCTSTATYTITQPAAISISGVVSNVSCHGGNNGAINTSISGGAAPYSYSWTGGSHDSDRTGLTAGTYYLTVTDANGCTSSTSFTVSQPSSGVSVTATTSGVSCNGGSNGSINTTATGGGGGYSYTWSNGSSLADPAGLTAGTYSVTVTDESGCSTTAAYTVSQPSALALTAVTTNVGCHGSSSGSINTTVTGGTPSYSYTWNTGSHVADPTGLTAGSYSVTVTDAHSCTTSGAYTLTQPATALGVTAVVANVSCYGSSNGAINTTVTGGSSPYSYSWSGCSVHDSDRTGLTATTYNVTVTDAGGCSASGSYTVNQPSALTAAISVSPTYCATGGDAYTIYLGYGTSSVTLSASASGGTSGYSYSWSTGSAASSITVSPTTTTTYTLTVTDAHGCTSTITQTIIVRDIRCGDGSVYICHYGSTISCGTSGVPGHIAHGDYFGSCSGEHHGDKSGTTSGSKGEVEVEDGKVPQVYPNPTDGTFNVVIPASNASANIQVSDMTGRVIETRTIEHNDGTPVQFSLSNAAKGIYLVKVNTDGKTDVFKIVVR